MSARDSIPSALPSTAAIRWLLCQAASAATPGILLGELCNRLLAEALPIDRASLTIASLDPLLAASRLRWESSNGRVLEEVLFHGMAALEEPADIARTVRIPLAASSHEIEWLASGAAGFTSEQQRYLGAISLVLAAPLQVVIERATVRNLLSAYLGRRSADKVLAGTVRRGIGEMIEAVIWVSDLRDFTLLSERLSPEQVIIALNDCCARLVGAVHPFGGEVLKFMGDGLLAIFPLAPQGTRAACAAALSAVRSARQGMAKLDEQRVRAGLPPLPFGVALHLGAVMYGNIGAPDRLDFTAIGPAVNLTSRIEELCRKLDCQVLVSAAVAAQADEPLAPMGRHSIRGVKEAVTVFTLPELAAPA
ncbi:MAG: adenylate/guanylate cyclase domain-containing protein [Deltaproteobacteria bacterium]|nr:adenylate/guanylate cyclase domain-containing protein [Deltaproteobacteria bacterium]